ncbi:MAG: transglycosylase SLT domain-containing protein [Rikenellaceae bacterium]
MRENRDHILATVLFSSTLTILVVLSVACYRSATNCFCQADMTWLSPSAQIVDETISESQGGEFTISPFDHLFRSISAEHDTDWQLMSAIAYAESRFKPYAVSRLGACGLMQVMPRSAAEFGVSADKLHDPEVNIWVANKIFKHIERMLSYPDNITDRDRISITLAAYNCGVGRLFDAQRLARSEGRNPYRWSNIATYLYRLNYPNYYNRAEVYHGRFRGAPTTVAYVNTVVETYNHYRRSNLSEAWTFVWK